MRSVGLLRYLVEHIPVDWNSVNGNAIGMAMRTVEPKRFKDALLDQIEDSGSFPSVEDLKSRVGLACGIFDDVRPNFLSGFGRQVTSVYQIT
uniref:Serine/threonine protein kinase n=1 Tax=Globodera pallida TaxID=36090 RepID=A0A183BLR9_GLOPA